MSQFGLGRGLDSLIPRKAPAPPVAYPIENDTVQRIPITAIIVNDYQPRQDFSEEDLDELAASVKEYGIIQPLVVTRRDDGYRLIAGERRLRAAKRAGLDMVPIVVRDADEHQRLALAIIENIQRVDLNPIETALAYKRLMDEFSLTQDEIAVKMGKSRPKVANALRLLKLHPEIQEALRHGKINEGHGKIMAGMDSEDEQLRLFKAVLERNMTVSDTARSVTATQVRRSSASPVQRALNPLLMSNEAQLREYLATKVAIQKKGVGGTIVIEFYSDDELRDILQKIIS